ncbi:MAG: DUF6544 family protein [Vicinamibacterales bacterium]
MRWLVLWALVTVIGAFGVVASFNSVRFARRVGREVREMAAASNAERRPLDPARLASLPPPVQRYLRKAIARRGDFIQRVRLRHAGEFRPSLDGKWLPISGQQHFNADPPGFIWWGRVRMLPGIWIDARDRSVGGEGNMWVTFESTVTIADSRGPELDQGALLRLLGEMAWFPTVFLDDRYVQWSAIDDRRAAATLRVGGRTVSGEFTFGPDGLPDAFMAGRYRDTGGGKSALTPFVGRVGNFRLVDGVLVPFRVIGAWVLDGQTKEYAKFDVEEIQFDRW